MSGRAAPCGARLNRAEDAPVEKVPAELQQASGITAATLAGSSSSGHYGPCAAMASAEAALQSLHLLSPFYAWFADGFDAPDLQDATALLGS